MDKAIFVVVFTRRFMRCQTFEDCNCSTMRMREGTTPTFPEAEEEDNSTTLTDVSTVMNSPTREQEDLNGSKRQRSQGQNISFPIMHAAELRFPSSRGDDRKKSISQHILQQVPTASENSKRLISKLKDLYKYKILPIEKRNYLHHFCLPTSGPIQEAEFDARPIVLLLGPYSTGKTTFIRHFIGGDFPGLHIGPEPTTDKFMAIVHGNEEGASYDEDKDDKDYFGSKDEHSKAIEGKIVKGNTLTVTPELPFASLAQFGSAFLNHFNGSVCSAPLLRNITLVDTPGVLSGEKQRISRDYDFAAAAKWFADRSDLILLLTDAHKLDFSDEFKEVVETIRPHNDDKIRCILNKADGVGRDQLVRVYESLMWSLGKLFHSPEVVRVYTGSFWDKPLEHDDFKDMFESDEWILMTELMNLPSVSAERKVNAIVQRIRLIKVHVCILGFLRSQMPRWYGKEKIRQRLIDTLNEVFDHVRIQNGLPIGDMPDVTRFRESLNRFEDFSVFPLIDSNAIHQLDDLITRDIPGIMKGSSGVSDSQLTPRSKRRVLKAKLPYAKTTSLANIIKSISSSEKPTSKFNVNSSENLDCTNGGIMVVNMTSAYVVVTLIGLIMIFCLRYLIFSFPMGLYGLKGTEL